MNASLKLVLAVSWLLVASVLHAQQPGTAISFNSFEYYEPDESPRVAGTGIFDLDAFTTRARTLNIHVQSNPVPESGQSGFYLISGVFSKKKYARRQIRKHQRDGLEAGSFFIPEPGLHYVYAERFDEPEMALQAALSGFDGRISGDLWVLAIGDAQVPESQTARTSQLPGPGQDDPLVSEPNPNNQVIRKADRYFDQMWYSEAAKLYEYVLARGEAYYTYNLLRKTADSHYFNTDMDRALHWYEILYERYAAQMSAADLFQYAHSLKGIGRYGRARRIMRLYETNSGAMSGEPEHRPNDSSGLATLDKIPNLEAAYAVANLEVNSRYAEFAPAFYDNNQVVFASSADSAYFNTRRYNWNGQPFLDLYVGRLNEAGNQISDAVKFSKKLNSKYHEAGVAFSPDRKTIYFTRNDYKKKLKRDGQGINNLKIYRSQKSGNDWSEPEELPFNGVGYSTGHPALSPDGKQLYFVSDMPGSIGDTDLFVVDVFEDGSFSAPRNLGPEINTPHKEMFPFMDEHKLYFSSNGHAGLGGLDIFEVAYGGEDGFLEVRNMGTPINSNRDDFSFIVDAATQKGFFASNRSGGKGDDDLYSFQRLLPEETVKNAIAGVVTDSVSREFIPEALIRLLDANNRVLREITSDSEGGFVFEDLESQTHYTVQVDKETYLGAIQAVETAEDATIRADVELRKLEEMIVVDQGVRKLKTDNIYFDFDKFEIRPDAGMELDKLVATMQEYPTMVIAIESHTDSRGRKAYNRYLSEKRAEATRKYLIAKGIDPLRIENATGYGEDRLLNECDGSVACNADQHQRNRRSEFIIVRM